MGLFFAPLLSGITLIKLFIVFYLRIIYLKYLCRPSKTLYEVRIFVEVIFNFSINHPGLEDFLPAELFSSLLLSSFLHTPGLHPGKHEPLQLLRAIQGEQ